MDFLSTISQISGRPSPIECGPSDGVRSALPAYKYLADKVLIVPDNKERFLEGVRDIFYLIQEEYYERYGDMLIPSVQQVSDAIDNENNDIISLFYDKDEETREKVRIIYMTEVTTTLSHFVVEALEELSMSYTGSSIGSVRKCIPGVKHQMVTFYDPYQIKMFGDDLYE